MRSFPFWGMALIISGIPTHLLLSNRQAIDEERQVLRYDYGVNLMKSTPKNSIFFAEAEEDYFPLYYFQGVEGKRLDIKMIPSFILFETWGVEQIQNLYPALGLTAASRDFPGQITRLTFAASEIIEKNIDRLPCCCSYFDGALHRYYLNPRPSLLFRESGIILELAPTPAQKDNWLYPTEIRIRHLKDCPSNAHESLDGIWAAYQKVGIFH